MSGFNRKDVYEIAKIGLLAKNTSDLSAIRAALQETEDGRKRQIFAKRLIVKWQHDIEAANSCAPDDARRYLKLLEASTEIEEHGDVLLSLDSHDDMVRAEDIRRTVTRLQDEFPPGKTSTIESFIEAQREIGELRDRIRDTQKEIDELPSLIEGLRIGAIMLNTAAASWPMVTAYRHISNGWTIGDSLTSLLIWIPIFMILAFACSASRKEKLEAQPLLPTRLDDENKSLALSLQKLDSLLVQLPELRTDSMDR